jgi:putative ABC transport system ATP-binding protein
MNILSIEHLYYSYDNGKTAVLNDINFDFEKGNAYAIVGKSGAGKTTLLSLMSGLASCGDGKILFDGRDISKVDKEKYRSRNIGIVFQSFNLLPHLTALENVILSMDVAGIKVENKKQHALNMLSKVGLDEVKANRRILKLSGGEQQRVAIARALSYNPDIILADEPTGNLDTETEKDVVDIFKALAHDDGKCVIIVTHSPSVSGSVDVVYELQPKLKKA